MKTTEIVSSRQKWFQYLVVSLVFVAVALHELRGSSTNGVIVWLVIGFFSLGSLVFSVLFFRPHRLMLDSAGFTVTGGLVRSPSKILWRDINGFFVFKLPRGGNMIGFNYAPGASKSPRLAKVNRTLGAEGALPRGWPQSPELMVKELNDYRTRALASRS